jgi:hypothetical protein
MAWIAGLSGAAILAVSAFLCAWFQPTHTERGRESTGDSVGIFETARDSLRERLEQTLARAESETDDEQREQILAEFGNGLGREDCPRVLEVLQGSRRSGQARLSSLILTHWAKGEPERAAAWTLASCKGAERGDAIASVAVAWAGRNAADAAQWARDLPSESDRIKAVKSVGYELSRTDPMTAIELALELPETDGTNALIVHSSLQWAAQDPRAAADWAKGLDESPMKYRILSHIAAAWAGSDPEAAATIAADSLPAGKAQDDAIVSIVQLWAQSNPMQAAQWVGRFPSGTLRDVAFENVLRIWAQRDAPGAARWAQKNRR